MKTLLAIIASGLLLQVTHATVRWTSCGGLDGVLSTTRYGDNWNIREELDDVPLHPLRYTMHSPGGDSAQRALEGVIPQVGHVEETLSEKDVAEGIKAMDLSSYEFQCGVFELPLDPRFHPMDSVNSTDPHMRVRVYRLKKKEMPVGGHTHYWALPGGPGVSGITMVSMMGYASTHELGSVIYVPDYRGTGPAGGSYCKSEGYGEFNLGIDWVLEVRDCIKGSPNYPYFSVTNAAHDILSMIKHEVETEVPSKEIRLHGFGFGTLWAQRILQIDDSLIDKVVLEGVVSKSYSFHLFAQQNQNAGIRLMEMCAKDPKCANYFPDKMETVKEIFESADKKTGQERSNCQKALSRFDGSFQTTMRKFLHLGLKYGQRINDIGEVEVDYRVFLLSILMRVHRCEGDDLKVVSHALRFLASDATRDLYLDKAFLTVLPDEERRRNQFDRLVYNAVVHAEMWNYTEFESTSVGTIFDELNKGGYFFTGNNLEGNVAKASKEYIYHADEYQVEFYSKNIATDVLVINGEIDGQTPVENAVEVYDAMTVAEGHHKVFAMIPAGGHIVTYKPCGRQVLKGFFADSTKKVSSCAIDDVNKVNEFQHGDLEIPSKLDPGMSGSTDIWDGGYVGCGNLSKNGGSCSAPKIRACDACFEACWIVHGTTPHSGPEVFTKHCECYSELAKCLDKIGCSGSHCTNVLESSWDIEKCGNTACNLNTGVIGSTWTVVGVGFASALSGALLTRYRYPSTRHHENSVEKLEASSRVSSIVPRPDVELGDDVEKV